MEGRSGRDGTATFMKSTRAVTLAAAGVTALVAFMIYTRTMAPTITWRHGGSDSGDLVTAAINLGVPHPTGYPLYTMLAHLFTAVPWGEPARNVNVFSAATAALAMGTVLWVAHRLVVAQEGISPVAALAPAWAAAGLCAFGELLWSQATIAEVYSLNALLVATLLAAALSLPSRARPYALALLFGLCLAHHITIVFLVPALWPYAPTIRRRLTLRRSLQIGLCLLPGLLAYLYIPIRAAIHPVPNWGQADNLSGLVWLASGVAYRGYLTILSPTHLLQRLSAWAGIWVRDFGVLGLALAMLGLWRGLETNRRFTLLGLTYVALVSLYAMLYITSDSYLYLIPAALVVALWLARGAATVLCELQRWAKSELYRRLVTVTCILILAIQPLISIISRFHSMDLSTDDQAYRFADRVLEVAAPNAIVVSNGDAQTFPLWYVRYGLGKRPDVTVVDRGLLAFDWYRCDLASRHPELAMLARTSNAQDAATTLVMEEALERPVHLTYSDDILSRVAAWSYEDPLFTLLRRQ